jgi:hypothetical protein
MVPALPNVMVRVRSDGFALQQESEYTIVIGTNELRGTGSFFKV